MKNLIGHEETKTKQKIGLPKKSAFISIRIDESDDEWQDWLALNSRYIYQQPNQTNIIIKLDLIGTPSEQAKWLKDNCKRIDFIHSQKYIYEGHRIIPLDIILFIAERIRLNNIRVKGSVKLQKIVDEINTKGASYSFNYNHYVQFNLINNSSVDPSENIILDIVENRNYTPNSNCYSIPLLKIIEQEFGLNTELEFYKIDFSNGVITIFKTNNNTTYFDYSQNPPLVESFIKYFLKKIKQHSSKKIIKLLETDA